MVTGELGEKTVRVGGRLGWRGGGVLEGRGGGEMLSSSELFSLLSPGSSGLNLVLLSQAVAILVP